MLRIGTTFALMVCVALANVLCLCPPVRVTADGCHRPKADVPPCHQQNNRGERSEQDRSHDCGHCLGSIVAQKAELKETAVQPPQLSLAFHIATGLFAPPVFIARAAWLYDQAPPPRVTLLSLGCAFLN